MKILIIENTAIKGEPVLIGDVVDTDDVSAKILIDYKLAEPYKEKSDESDDSGAGSHTKKGRKQK